MKTKIFLFLTVVLLVFNSCGKSNENTDQDKFYRDFDLILVSINGETTFTEGESSLSNDKHHSPQLCNTILFRTSAAFENKYNTTHLYREINTCVDKMANDNCGCGSEGFHIDTKWLYNHQSGDILHFDYMLKEKFFDSDLLDEKLGL
jgi:hypothetical protein